MANIAKVKLNHFKKTVALAGTAEPLIAINTIIQSIVIQAESDNSGKIYIGNNTVSSTNTVALTAGNSLDFSGDSMGMGGDYEFDLSQIYIDADTDGDGVTVLFITRD